ncbi:MAG: hemolysin family protein [Bryobacterales bacterium]|nr:hemolysin family protein [Bryobacterales bacterium]
MEEVSYGYRFLLLAVILAANAFFAGAEVALVSVRPSRLRELAKQGHPGAQAALSLLANPERLLSVVQVGVTAASLGLGWAGEDTLYRFFSGLLEPVLSEGHRQLLHGVSFLTAFLLMSYLHVVLGEVAPKNLGMEKADRLAVLVAPPLLVFYRVVEPFVYVIERSAAAASRLLGLRSEPLGGGHSAEELKLILSREQVRFPRFEREAIQRLLDLGGVAVREIMVPRNDVVAVAVDAPLEDIVGLMLEHQYSRVPVYEGQPERVLGILHFKDLLRLREEFRAGDAARRAWSKFRLRSVLHKPLVVPESKPVSQMLDEFRRSRCHMALVVDEFGTISGIVTMEDVLEQIFGEIEDEHDAVRQAPAPSAAALEVEGTINIRDLAARYGIRLPSGAGFETLAGFLLYRLGYIPKAGDSVDYDGRRYTVLEMERNRIARVRIEALPVAEPTPPTGPGAPS